MGMFDDFGLEDPSIAEPGQVAAGQYEATVFGFEFQPAKPKPDNSHVGRQNLVLTYKITGPSCIGETVREYKSANANDDAKTKGWLKARLKSLGIPESKFGSLIPADVLGTPVYITVVHKNGYTNVSQVNSKANVTANTQVPVTAGAATGTPDW